MNINKFYEILLSNDPINEITKNEDYIFKLIPEFKKCKKFNQNNIWHIYDVYNHILHVVNNVSKVLPLRMAAIFHDVGKPNTYKEDENGVGHFYGHWDESRRIFINFSNKYKIDNDLKELVSKLIYYHDINIGSLDNSELNALLNKFNKDEIIMLYDLKKADLLAQNRKFHYILDDYEKQKVKILSMYDYK